MKVGASIGLLSEKIKVPPYHKTRTIRQVPRNSLTG